MQEFKLNLNICASSQLISIANFCNSFVLKPSVSQLFLVFNDLIISLMCTWLVVPRSKFCTFSSTGIKSSAFAEVGNIDSAMFTPTLVKKSLNSLAISRGPVKIFPSLWILSILDFGLFKLAASLSNSQERWDLLHFYLDFQGSNFA
jgi:hypothetical protein